MPSTHLICQRGGPLWKLGAVPCDPEHTALASSSGVSVSVEETTQSEGLGPLFKPALLPGALSAAGPRKEEAEDPTISHPCPCLSCIYQEGGLFLV